MTCVTPIDQFWTQEQHPLPMIAHIGFGMTRVGTVFGCATRSIGIKEMHVDTPFLFPLLQPMRVLELRSLLASTMVVPLAPTVLCFRNMLSDGDKQQFFTMVRPQSKLSN